MRGRPSGTPPSTPNPSSDGASGTGSEKLRRDSRAPTVVMPESDNGIVTQLAPAWTEAQTFMWAYTHSTHMWNKREAD